MNLKPFFCFVLSALGSVLTLSVPWMGVAQTINVGPGQTIANSTVIANGTTVNVDGGTIGLGVDLQDGTLNINSGNVAIGATGIPTGFTNSGNQITLNGGQVGGFFQLFDDSEFVINGGSVESFGVFNGSRVTINGGSVTRFPDIFGSGVVDIRGGDVFSIRVFSGGTVNLFGSQFSLDGQPIENLVIGQEFVVSERNVTLAGVLEDGSSIETTLSTMAGSFSGPEPDAAAVGSRVTVTLVAAQGDFNSDGVVNAADINFYPTQIGLSVSDLGFDSRLDLNNDDVIDLFDHNQLITQLVQTSNGRTGALIGDANLDGVVDVLGDAFALVANLNSTGVVGYEDGDFDADEQVTVLGDAFLLVANLGQSN